jgi:hypothetical protein
MGPIARRLLPDHAGIADLQRVCELYPSTIPEEKTIRRFFGPEATRADVLRRPAAGTPSLLSRLAALLSDPAFALRAGGAVILNTELDRLTDAILWRSANAGHLANDDHPV